MNRLKDIFVSAVVVLTDKDQKLTEGLQNIQKTLESHFAHYELLVIDTENAGRDFSGEMDIFLKNVPKTRYIRLFNTLTDSVLFAAGLENAIGDIILAAPLYLYNEKNILQTVDLCCAGNDLVNGISPFKKSLLNRLGSWIFRKFFSRMIGCKVPSNNLPFRGVSRRLVNAALSMDHFHDFVFLRLSQAGGNHAPVILTDVSPENCKEKSLDSFSRAVSMLVFNTTTPLKFINILALFSSFAAFLFTLYTLVINFCKNNVVEGWTTLMLVISSLFFMLFLILTFIGEYLVRLVTDQGRKRCYNVIFEKHSSVMLDYNKLNIRDDSVSQEINLTQTGRDR